MGWVKDLQRAINFMEDHLLDDISIAEIAQQAYVSEFHFQRIFTILTDISVGDYLRRRRLTLAAHELTNSDNKVIEIALKYGYDTPEAFSKAFRRQHGLTPSQARNHMGKLKLYNRLGIQVNLKGAEPMNFRIVEKESFQVAGVKQGFSFANNENLVGIPKMWEDVHADGTHELLLQLNNGDMKGTIGVCVDQRNEATDHDMNYWIATAYVGDAPEEFDVLEVPASKWGVFEVHGPMPEAMQNTWKQIFSEWFPSNQFQHAGTVELEVYSPGDAWSPDYYSEIWIPLK